MQIASYILDNEAISKTPCRVVAKRYTLAAPTETGPLVILMHGTGFHKESWEPTIESLLALDSTIEAWAVDAPKHGESAAMGGPDASKHVLTIEDYARTVLVLFESTPCPIANFQQRPLFVVGHSAGGSSACVLVTLLDHPNTHLILVEPVPELFTPDPEKLTSHRGMGLHELTKTKRDIWSDRQSAKEWHANRAIWQAWNPRALDLFIKFGLRDLPTAEYPNKKGVTLACSKADELWIYSPEGFTIFQDCVRVFQSSAIGRVPVHVVFAEKSFFRVKPKDPIYKNITGKLGCTVEIIPKAGHLIVQEAPEALAGTLYKRIAQSCNYLKPKL